MEDYKEKYEKLKQEFEVYQNFTEEKLQMLINRNNLLEKNLDAVSNVVEISKYINSYLGDENLIPMINDMIIGILGATYSSVYMNVGKTAEVKASNKKPELYHYFEDERINSLNSGEPFVINSKIPVYKSDYDNEIHSILGVPIKLRDKYIGYIIVEHTLWNYFSKDHIKFVYSIANQIAIAIENNVLYNKVREASITDPLLNIYNRRYFFEKVSSEIANNPNIKSAVVMMDIDHFKKVNDKYGHQFGDETLKVTSEIVNEGIRENGIIARYGGEEVVIFIRDAENYDKLYRMIDSIRYKIENNTINFGGESSRVTASFGISFYPQDGFSLDEIINCADAMMYEAKFNGRNKVISSHMKINR
ncbi:sensor domain-containing diguanylate cyclase [Clostridium sp. 19966]|uniref:sensor domain-containing diguanylate cyclase n=1 Tax=Clostridium sp. 19966 TaxID=2768166 RepID=UPI0028DDD288|nr:sensor domain-containing diguanylate cyclase [Clostridium sp. 19966]MDT8719031.1 sensor domain-containing diguanylate cyclase [Clostridium sp. 19966]